MGTEDYYSDVSLIAHTIDSGYHERIEYNITVTAKVVRRLIMLVAPWWGDDHYDQHVLYIHGKHNLLVCQRNIGT